METVGDLATLTPFWTDRGTEDLILLLLLCILLIPATTSVWLGSLVPRSIDAILYDRGHIFFRKLSHYMPTGGYILLGALQRHLLVALAGYLLLKQYIAIPLGRIWDTIALIGVLALGSLLLSLLYLGTNRILAQIYLDSTFYLHWARHYYILEWLWAMPLYISSLLLLIGVGREVALWSAIGTVVLWRLAIIIPTTRWLRSAGISALLISLYLCALEIAPLAYLIGVGMLLL